MRLPLISRMFRNNTILEKYGHLKAFKKMDTCIPDAWIVIRLDGHGFSRFTDLHNFEKPNDIRGLELMNRSAVKVMEELKDICFAFGQSDEYSFIIKKNSQLYNRCRYTISTTVCSLFTSAYVSFWRNYFGYLKLLRPPSFDCRVIIYPSDSNLRDYLSWRQVDVHINNLYNTVFWALVKKGNRSRREAQAELRGTVSKDKHEILFKNYGINYNNEPEMFKKGTALMRKLVLHENSIGIPTILELNCDIIGDKFWTENSEILTMESLQVFRKPEQMIGYEIGNSMSTQNKIHELIDTKLMES